MFSTDDQQNGDENQTPSASKKIRYHGKFSLYFMHVLSLDPIADVTCISKVNHRRTGKGPCSQSFVTVLHSQLASLEALWIVSVVFYRSQNRLWVVCLIHRIGVVIVQLLHQLPCGSWGSWW